MLDFEIIYVVECANPIKVEQLFKKTVKSLELDTTFKGIKYPNPHKECYFMDTEEFNIECAKKLINDIIQKNNLSTEKNIVDCDVTMINNFNVCDIEKIETLKLKYIADAKKSEVELEKREKGKK